MIVETITNYLIWGIVGLIVLIVALVAVWIAIYCQSEFKKRQEPDEHEYLGDERRVK